MGASPTETARDCDTARGCCDGDGDGDGDGGTSAGSDGEHEDGDDDGDVGDDSDDADDDDDDDEKDDDDDVWFRSHASKSRCSTPLLTTSNAMAGAICDTSTSLKPSARSFSLFMLVIWITQHQ